MSRPLFIIRGFRKFWNGRDDRGHYLDHYLVTKAGNDAGNCPHACCANARPHPAGEHVQRATSSTTNAPETDAEALDRWYAEQSAIHADRYPREDESSDPADHDGSTWQGTSSTATTARGRAADHANDYLMHNAAAAVAAENATNGYMIRPDRKREYDQKHGNKDVLNFGPASTAYYYASEELRNYWEDHPRQTLAEYAQAHGDTTAKTAKAAAAAKAARSSAAERAQHDPARAATDRARAAAARARRKGPMSEGDKLAAARRRLDRARKVEAAAAARRAAAAA